MNTEYLIVLNFRGTYFRDIEFENFCWNLEYFRGSPIYGSIEGLFFIRIHFFQPEAQYSVFLTLLKFQP